MGDGGQFAFRHARGEALDGVIARVHFHDRRGARDYRLLVIARMRAVGGADLFQLAAGARHDVGDAEGAADFNELAARHDDFFFRGQRIQHEIHRRGVVVHDDGGFGAGQALQPGFDVAVAFAARAAAEIEFEIHRAGHRGSGCRRGHFGIQRAAEIGMQDGAGQVEDGSQRWLTQCVQSRRALSGERFLSGRRRSRVTGEDGALVVKHRAQGFDYERTAVPVDEGDDRVELEQAVDRRQRATRGGSGIQHDRGGERRDAADHRRCVSMCRTGAHGAAITTGRGRSLAQFSPPMLLWFRMRPWTMEER